MKLEELLKDAIKDLESCIKDKQRLIDDVLTYSDCKHYTQGMIDGYQEAIDLLNYIIEQAR